MTCVTVSSEGSSGVWALSRVIVHLALGLSFAPMPSWVICAWVMSGPWVVPLRPNFPDTDAWVSIPANVVEGTGGAGVPWMGRGTHTMP